MQISTVVLMLYLILLAIVICGIIHKAWINGQSVTDLLVAISIVVCNVTGMFIIVTFAWILWTFLTRTNMW